MTAERSNELAPRYDAAVVEPAIYERWLASGVFTPPSEPPSGAERFVIIQPPPNVTGALHLGHALTAFVEDIMVRYHRMRGDDTLWLPGVDHASIAAQFVLDRILAEEGESRQSLGRERYLERMWQFMDETRDVIGRQHRALGASLDWTRLHFTMEEGSARAVRVAFKRLWDAGLAYRGEALVNWCPRCRTTISDLENAKHEETGSLWTVRYHLVGTDGSPDPNAWISVATTRPETILGDTAVAVHPDDDRYRALVGRQAVIPFVDRRVPIIADDAVERDFGTGAVKITPAHDFDDYEMGKRHGLPMITVLDEDARLAGDVGPFAGMDRYEARTAVLEKLQAEGDLESEETHQMVIGRCDRCGTVVEPRLSVQWFINVKPLAERALASVRKGRTRIMPVHFEKVYAHWMENIHDWAVGRQLWWGHRIPAWYCPDGHITVSDAEDGPQACTKCGRPAAELTQETDIFDTWFSSGLWPFSTLGWPDATSDLARFYPTSVMETAYEILFFWVARMMMLGLYLTGEEPFHTVYLHGIVRDPYGQKMSKTRGNVVDPLQTIAEVGADALRLALVSGNAPGVDQRLTDAKLTGGRNFTNKLWNAARYVLGSRPVDDGALQPRPPADDATLAQAWIRSRLAAATERATEQLDRLDLAGYVATVHEFAWSEYFDWYLEMAKVERRNAELTSAGHAASWRTSAAVLVDLLALLHPIAPFVTEAIWERIHALDPALTGERPLLVAARWPVAASRAPAVEADVAALQELIRDVRDQRTAQHIPAGAAPELQVLAASPDARDLLHRAAHYARALARLGTLAVLEPDAAMPPAHASNTRLGTSWLVLDAEEATDGAGEERRRRREAELHAGIDRLRSLLANSAFVERAPADVVQRERARLAELEGQLQQLGAAD
jgi:valyl-tRNA synthetase